MIRQAASAARRERAYVSAIHGALVTCALGACVPEGPATTTDAGTPPPKPAPAPAAVSVVPRTHASAAAATPLGPAFEDHFERAELGPDYNALSPQWKIEGGRLCARGARNHGVWLLRKLPVNARVEFDAIASSPDGDIKVEMFGDGMTGATGTSYSNATSYLAILGGWKNTRHVLARINEHGDDRLEFEIDPASDDERARPVSPGQPYHFKIERTDGKTVEWSVNGVQYFRWPDPEPLAGAGHEFFGFNDWEAPVCFDNLKVTAL